MQQKDTKQKEDSRSTRRFFIALLPPPEIQQEIDAIKHHFAAEYQSRKALNSPPHITLQPPFDWHQENLPILEQNLKEFAATRSPLPLTLDGFGAFPPKVIYINPQATPVLLELREDLKQHLAATLGIVNRETRPFSPHLTIAFRDLSRANFKLAWPQFQDRTFFREFVASHLTLLIYHRQKWAIQREFLFENKCSFT